MKCSWIVTLLLASLPVLMARDAFYDCNRLNQGCGTGGTCEPPGGTEGECTCAGDADSELANVDNPCFDPDTDPATQCDGAINCNGNGDCRAVEGGTETCFCNDDYWGTACDKKRVVVTCEGANFKVEITPFGDSNDGAATTFAGKIYASGQSATAGCSLNPQGPTPATFEQTFAYTGGSCGVQKTDPVSSGDPTIYEIPLRVQHSGNPDVLVGNDLVVIAKCTFAPNVATGVGTGIIGAADPDLNEVTEDQAQSSVQLDLFSSSDGTNFNNLVNDLPLPIGTDLHLRFFLPIPNGPGFTTFLVQQCVGQDSETGPSKTLEIVDTNGCPKYRPPTVSKDHIPRSTDADGVRVSVPIQLFKFVGIDTLFFSCTVKTCITAGDCTAPDCSALELTGGAGRRRREADTESVQVQARVLVFSRDDAVNANAVNRTAGTQTPQTNDDKNCLEDARTMTIISILAVFVIVLLIACLVIAYCASKRVNRRKGDYYDNHAFSSTQNFAIPRPRS